MSTTARCPSIPSASNTTTPTSMVSSTDAIGVTTSISLLGSGRFSSLMRMRKLPGRLGRRRGVFAVDAAHQQPDPFDIRPLDLHGLAQPPLVDHRQRVAQRQEFIEI